MKKTLILTGLVLTILLCMNIGCWSQSLDCAKWIKNAIVGDCVVVGITATIAVLIISIES